MNNKKFGIKEVLNIRLVNPKTGEEIKDIRDTEPTERKFDPSVNILDLVKSTSPSYEMCNHPLIRKYGYDTFGSIYEVWYWKDNLSEATELELWQIFGLIQADWLANYEYWYRKEEYEFRKYKRENKSNESLE